MAMSVNMFGLRLTTDCRPRTKNGQPAQKTTGAAPATWPGCVYRLLKKCTYGAGGDDT